MLKAISGTNNPYTSSVTHWRGTVSCQVVGALRSTARLLNLFYNRTPHCIAAYIANKDAKGAGHGVFNKICGFLVSGRSDT